MYQFPTKADEKTLSVYFESHKKWVKLPAGIYELVTKDFISACDKHKRVYLRQWIPFYATAFREFEKSNHVAYTTCDLCRQSMLKVCIQHETVCIGGVWTHLKHEEFVQALQQPHIISPCKTCEDGTEENETP